MDVDHPCGFPETQDPLTEKIEYLIMVLSLPRTHDPEHGLP